MAQIIKPQAFRAGAPEQNPRTGAQGQSPRAGTSLLRRAPLQNLPEASKRPAESECPQRPAPVEGVTPLSQPALSQSTPRPLGVPPVENGSVYFIPYKYYLMSETMAFSGTAGWKNSQRYQEFLRVIRGKISGSGYDEKEAAVVCRIFKADMYLMFCEKAIQEIRERGFGLTQAQKEEWNAIYSKRLHDAKSAFAKRKTLPPPPDFNQDALWFASFSSDQAPCLPSAGEHAGSIYFDGGRIRLMHVNGPALKRGTPARTFDGKFFLKKPETAQDREDLEALVRKRKREGKPITLVECSIGGDHISRGYPKIVELIDEDIAQLYYLADRISTVLSGAEDWELRSQGFSYISQERIISAGNKLMAEFIRGHARLKAVLGYG